MIPLETSVKWKILKKLNFNCSGLSEVYVVDKTQNGPKVLTELHQLSTHHSQGCSFFSSFFGRWKILENILNHDISAIGFAPIHKQDF